MLSYALRDLLRNPGRTLAAFAGVALAVALVAATAFFVDASAARMTQRAIAPVAIDMQAGLTNPLASPLQLTETTDAAQSLGAGQAMTVTLKVLNGGNRPMTGIVVRDEITPPLAYVAGSTTLGGSAVPDAAGESPVLAGLRAGNLAAGASTTITYRVTATTAVPATQALQPHGLVTSVEEPAPSAANAQPALSIESLSSRVLQVPGVASADVLGVVDLGAGSLRGNNASINQQLRVLAIDPRYLDHFNLIAVSQGRYDAGSVLLSSDAAAALHASPGQPATLAVPGRAAPIPVTVGGVADFTRADLLFASRAPDAQGEYAALPNVIVVPVSMFENTILPALRLNDATSTSLQKPAPYFELDLHVDRSRLNSDPTVAVVTTQGLKRAIERVAPGQVTVIDNLSDSLGAARGDTILAKILFLFLGLPGVLLAAYLSRYAGGLLAEAQRRERATLRARGAQPRHLISALTYTTIAVAVVGAALGLAAGAAVVAFVLGPAELRTASTSGLLLSAGTAVGAGLVTTALALYLPGRRALTREAGEERRELEVATAPLWRRMRLDLALLAAAALVWIITLIAGGFRPTPAEGQSVTLSFYTLLAPLLGWLGATLLGVRLLLLAGSRLGRRAPRGFTGAASGVLRRSVQRRSLPLASAVIAVGLAVSFGASLNLLVATYDAEKSADARFVVGGDIRVTPSAAAPQQASFAGRLLVPGVAAVTPVAQTSSAIVGTDKKTLVSIDPAGFTQVATLPDSFFSGISSRDAMAALERDPSAVLIAAEMARTFNVQTGDQVRVQLPGANGKPVPVTFHAAGIFVNFPGYPQGIDLVGNLTFYRNATGSSRADAFLVRTDDRSAAGVTRVAAALKAAAGSPLLIETTATAINRDASSLTALNMRGLGTLEALFAVVMSAIGIAIFVFGLLLQRRKELITMRALGMGLTQLRALVAGEATIVAVFSLIIGAAVGAAMAAMFVQVLAPLFTIPPAGLTIPGAELGLLATLVLAGVGISSLVSGRILRRLNPAELLREE